MVPIPKIKCALFYVRFVVSSRCAKTHFRILSNLFPHKCEYSNEGLFLISWGIRNETTVCMYLSVSRLKSHVSNIIWDVRRTSYREWSHVLCVTSQEMRYSQHSQTKYQIFKNNRICKIYCLPEKSGNVFYGKTRVFSNGRMFPSLKMRLLIVLIIHITPK